jgi:hypothetical protein
MKIERGKMPKKFEIIYDANVLAFEELERIKKLGTEYVVYWYGTGCFEGAGALLFLIGNSWYYHNLAHCSCSEPTDHLSLKFPIDFPSRGTSLEVPKGRFTAEALEEIQPLLKLARRYIKIREKT